MRWDDPVYLGGLGFGVLLDLERRGYDVGVDPEYATGAEPHRVFCPGEYDAVLTVATSPSRVADWRARPGVREVAAADPRTPEERAASDRDRAILAAYLDEQGKPSEQADVDAALTGFVLSTKLPRSVNDAAGRLIATSVPSAVFVTDPAPEAGPVPRTPPHRGLLARSVTAGAVEPRGPGGVRRTGRVGPRMIPRCSRSSAAW